MAKTRYIQNSFLSGELSPLVKGNITLAQYYQGLEQAKNVMVVPQGGVKRRGGLKYVATNAAGSAKLLDFNTSTSNRYLLCVTAGDIAVYLAGDTNTLLGNLSAPYLDAEVSELRHVTTENVCLIFHENHPTQRIIFTGGTSFTIGAAPFTNVPQFDFNDATSPTPVSEVQVVTFASFVLGQVYQIDVEGVLSKSITYAGDATADQQAATVFNMQKNLQDMPVFGETGVTVARTGAAQFTITIAGESAKAFQLFSGFGTTGSASSTLTFTKSATGTARKEDVWSANRGYPRLGAFFEGRLWLGGTRDKSQSLFASKSGALLDFEIDEGADDEAIFITLTSRTLTEITDIYGGRNLQIFTSGGEYAILEASTTAATINARNQTSNGSLYIAVQEADGSVIFCDKNGKTLREYAYTFNEDSYASNDITVLSSHLITAPTDAAFLTGTASDDSNWLFTLNTDGTASILNKLRAQDINAFTSMSLSTQFNLDTKMEAVEVVDEEAYFVVKRFNGSDTEISTIEKLDFSSLTDGSVTGTATGTKLVGLTHLIGFEVSVVGDGAVLPKRTVDGSGEITLTTSELANHTNFEAGINFVPTVQPMPSNTNIGSGENFMRIKRVVRVNLRVYETKGLYVDGVPVPIRSFGSDTLDQAALPYTGIIDDQYPTDGWTRDEMPIFTCPDPTPMHIQAIELEIESS